MFGLNIPQISAIARKVGPNSEIATALWAERSVRESRLLALYIMGLLNPPDRQGAIALAADVQSPEEADVLAFKVLKRTAHAASLLDDIERMHPFGEYLCASLKRHLE